MLSLRTPCLIKLLSLLLQHPNLESLVRSIIERINLSKVTFEYSRKKINIIFAIYQFSCDCIPSVNASGYSLSNWLK